LAYYNLKDFENAAIYGERALEDGKNDFDLYKLLTNIYYSQKKHIETAQYAEKAIQNPKLSSTDILVIKILRFFRLIAFIPIFKNLVIKISDEVQATIEHKDEWIEWAKNYIKWYSQNKEELEANIS
jgi:tetratricopeptide (TPR) repeat protein